MIKAGANKDRKLRRQFTIQKDDPFASLFIKQEDIRKQIALKLKQLFQEKNQERLEELKKTDGDKKRAKVKFQDSSLNLMESEERRKERKKQRSSVDCSAGGYSWQTERYWKLPENVRHAIDVAEMKNNNTEF